MNSPLEKYALLKKHFISIFLLMTLLYATVSLQLLPGY